MGLPLFSPGPKERSPFSRGGVGPEGGLGGEDGEDGSGGRC